MFYISTSCALSNGVIGSRAPQVWVTLLVTVEAEGDVVQVYSLKLIALTRLHALLVRGGETWTCFNALGMCAIENAKVLTVKTVKLSRSIALHALDITWHA